MDLKNIDMTFLVEMATEYGVGIVSALAIFIIGKWVAKRLTGVIRSVMKRAKFDPILISFLGNIVYTLMLVFVVIAALSQLGVETTSLAAVLAAAGLAVGLALQGSLSNFASGVLLIIFRPFKKGDYVDAGGVSGTVDEISIFTTLLKTPDNRFVIVPNGQITGSAITNYSAAATRRIDLVIGVGYSDDLAKTRDILNGLLAADTRILKDPAPVVAVAELGDSSVNFYVRPWVATGDYWAVRWDLIEKIKTTFDAEGISIPFPQRDIHVIDAQSALTGKKAA